jgi:hypothetical protein
VTSRRALPVATRRAVLAEAGYRCAVPTCRTILALDLHHIEDLQDGGGDEVSNLIALCPTCHALYTRGTITRDAIQLWKRRLVALNNAGAKNVARAYIVLRSDPVELQHAINVRSVKVAHDVSHRPWVHVTWDRPFADAFYDVNIGSVEYILGPVSPGIVPYMKTAGGVVLEFVDSIGMHVLPSGFHIEASGE